MDFDIVEPRAKATEDKSVAEALNALMLECKGSPCRPKEPLKKHKCMYTLDHDYKMQSATKVLGAIYWASKASVFEGKNLKDFASGLLLEPGHEPGMFVRPTKCYYEHSTKPDLIGLPRFFGLSVFGPPERDLRTRGLGISPCVPISLRDLQQQAVKQTLETLETWGGSMIVADCGFGKTRIAVALMATLGRRTLVLCNREVLMQQWSASILELQPHLKIAWLQGQDSLTKKRKRLTDFWGPSEDHDVCIASIDTLVDSDVPRSIIETYGLVIVDECHHLAAATLVHALPLVPARYVVGLSATPDRRDGLEHALYWLCGPASFVYKRLPSITGIYDSVEIQHIQTDCKVFEKIYANGQLAFAEMLTSLSENTQRNQIIVDSIAALSQRRKIIVVSGLVAHCVALKELCGPLNLEMALMAGPHTETAKAKSKDTRIVFATYSMLEEGYDDPLLDTLVLATPRSRIQQTVGRIERTHEGKLRPLVLDFVDPLALYENMWRKRLKFYRSRGFSLNSCE